MYGLLSAVRAELENKEFRQAYVAENARRGVAYQIRALREAQGWSQAEFARRAGKPHSNIHRWEDPTYGKFNLSTLIEIASTFDVGLIVRFASFGEMLASVSDLRPETLAVPTYEKEKEIGARHPSTLAIDALLKLAQQRPLGHLAEEEAQSKQTTLLPRLPEPEQTGSALTRRATLLAGETHARALT